ncbi:MAG: ABC transporter permease [Verrucomicrobiota bacterium]
MSQQTESETQAWDVVITSKKLLFNFSIRELWSYRDLMLLTIYRDFVAMHKQTVMGFLWYVIPPVIMTVVYKVVFGNIAKMPTNQIPPFLFFMSGIVLWAYFSACISKTATTFTSNAPLFTKIYFPRLVLPIAGCISNLWQFLVQLLIFAGFYIYFLINGSPISFSYRIIIVPFLVLQIAVLGFGAGCWISALTTRFRDLQLAVAPVIQMWMYASCIFYPRSSVPENLQWVMSINPLVPIIEAFRFAVMGQGQVSILNWLFSVVITLIMLIIGVIEFGRAEKTMADTI